MSLLIVSVHDVSPATSAESLWWVDRLEDLGIRATILLIPGPWRGCEMTRSDRIVGLAKTWSDRGHELSLHGWRHTQRVGGLTARLAARGAGEFAGLDSRQAENSLTAGLQRLDELSLVSSGFTPPGWLISTGSRDAVDRLGIGYFTTHRTIHDRVRGREYRVPVVCHRPSSVLSGAGNATVRLAWKFARATRRDLRLAIHPDDTHSRCLRETTLSVLRSAVDSGVEVLSYADYLEAA